MRPSGSATSVASHSPGCRRRRVTSWGCFSALAAEEQAGEEKKEAMYGVRRIFFHGSFDLFSLSQSSLGNSEERPRSQASLLLVTPDELSVCCAHTINTHTHAPEGRLRKRATQERSSLSPVSLTAPSPCPSRGSCHACTAAARVSQTFVERRGSAPLFDTSSRHSRAAQRRRHGSRKLIGNKKCEK